MKQYFAMYDNYILLYSRNLDIDIWAFHLKFMYVNIIPRLVNTYPKNQGIGRFAITNYKKMYSVKILIIGNSYCLEIHYPSRPKCIFIGYLSISIKVSSFLQYINQCNLSYHKVKRSSI